MIRRWFKGMLWISRHKYFLIMKYVYNDGRKQGRNELLRQLVAEQQGKGCIVGPGDYKKAVAEAERIVRGE